MDGYSERSTEGCCLSIKYADGVRTEWVHIYYIHTSDAINIGLFLVP